MRSLADRVRRTILEQRLVGPSGCVVAAVSGGSDSVAMVHLLEDLDGRGVLRLVGLAHFNHQLRRAAADDEAFCRTLALQLGLPIDVESADVAALADRLGVSIEVAGRDARYAFLGRAAGRARADRVAVGHTLDDQAETFLLRLLRGAGTRGMAAIRPRAGLVIRPLIDLRRDDLRAYLAAAGLAFREDESNRDLANPRNLIRHEVLPYLTRAVGSDVALVLAREAAIARDDSAYLEARAIETEPGIVVSRDADIALDLEGLRALDPALARRVVQRALARAAGGRFIGFDHVEATLELAIDGTGSAGIDLPGQRAELVAGRLRLRPADRSGEAADTGGPTVELADSVPLAVPGRVELPRLGWAVSAEPLDRAGVKRSVRPGPDALEALVAVDRSTEVPEAPLAVRTRRPGDRLSLPGLNGHKKLQDVFVDRKVPREARDQVPVVVDRHDRIVWVVGHAVAGDFRVTAASQAVILLKASRLGGQG